MKDRGKQRFIYFMKPVGMDGPIKIGCSYVPAKRLIALTIYSPFDLEIITVAPGSLALEKNVHECFADLHLRREWFQPAPKLVDAIEKIKGGAAVEQAINLHDRTGSIRPTNIRHWAPPLGAIPKREATAPVPTGLTIRQHELWVFIAAYVERTGICPSYEEMRRALGLGSKSDIARLVVALEQRGVIKRNAGRARSINLMSKPEPERAAA